MNLTRIETLLQNTKLKFYPKGKNVPEIIEKYDAQSNKIVFPAEKYLEKKLYNEYYEIKERIGWVERNEEEIKLVPLMETEIYGKINQIKIYYKTRCNETGGIVPLRIEAEQRVYGKIILPNFTYQIISRDFLKQNGKFVEETYLKVNTTGAPGTTLEIEGSVEIYRELPQVNKVETVGFKIEVEFGSIGTSD